jgi:tRNA1Val (adenine37-N6)-methyltransferase
MMKASFMTTSPPPIDGCVPATSDDSFLSGAISLRQPCDGYRVGTDAVMLAATINPPNNSPNNSQKKEPRMLDMGAGVGGVCLAIRTRLLRGHITAIEKDEFCAELLAHNIAQNNLSTAIRPVAGDVTNMPAMLRASFDAVFANPPFHHASDKNPRFRRRSLAHNGDGETSLSDWVRAGLWALRDKGRLSFIVRADRTDEVMIALRDGGAGEILLYPLWSYATSPAVRMVITARKGVKGAMALLPGLVLHRPSGALTPATQKVMKGGRDNLNPSCCPAY